MFVALADDDRGKNENIDFLGEMFRRPRDHAGIDVGVDGNGQMRPMLFGCSNRHQRNGALRIERAEFIARQVVPIRQHGPIPQKR